MSRKKSKSAKPKMTDEQRVAFAAVLSMGGSLAGEADIGDMQAMIAGAQQMANKPKPAAKAKAKPKTRKPPRG